MFASSKKTPVPTVTIRAVEFTFIVLLIVMLARIVYSFVAPVPTIESRSEATTETTPRETSQQISSPFPSNDAPANELVVAETDDFDDLAETSLDLTLKGVWPEGDGGGSAQIETTRGDEKSFAVGDEITNGVSLENVFYDRVTILRNGVREALLFENPPFVMPERQSRPQERTRATRGGPASAAVISQVTDVVKFTPQLDNDGNVAVLLNPGRNRTAFAQLGLERGDMLIAVDGRTPPVKPLEVAGFIAELHNKPNISITVRRGDDEIAVPINLSQLRQ